MSGNSTISDTTIGNKNGNKNGNNNDFNNDVDNSFYYDNSYADIDSNCNKAYTFTEYDEEFRNAIDGLFNNFVDLLQLQKKEKSDMFQGMKSQEYLGKMEQITMSFLKVEYVINLVQDPKFLADFEFLKKWERINYCREAVNHNYFLKLWEKHNKNTSTK